MRGSKGMFIHQQKYWIQSIHACKNCNNLPNKTQFPIPHTNHKPSAFFFFSSSRNPAAIATSFTYKYIKEEEEEAELLNIAVAMAVWRLQNLRWVTIILVIANVSVFLLGGFLVFGAYRSCDHKFVLPLAAVSCLAGVKIAAMVQSAIAQEAAARIVLETNADGTTVFDSVLRNDRRVF